MNLRNLKTNCIYLVLILIISSVYTQGDEIAGAPSVERPPGSQDFRTQDLSTVYSLLLTSNVSNLVRTSSLDTYNLATYFFNIEYFYPSFPVCDACKSIEYFAFRVGSYYLTARANVLRLQLSSNPTNAQLFRGEQQIDGTWAFKSLTQGRYIRADDNGSTINYQTYVGAWQRWYMQRHGNHLHIQSAQFAHYWWTFGNNNVLRQTFGAATPIVVEHLPRLQWLWNW